MPEHSSYVDGVTVNQNSQIVSFKLNAKNPISPVPSLFTPGISASLDFEFSDDADEVSVQGQVTMFPQIEISVTRQNGQVVSLYNTGRPSANTTLLLFFWQDVPRTTVRLKREVVSAALVLAISAYL